MKKTIDKMTIEEIEKYLAERKSSETIDQSEKERIDESVSEQDTGTENIQDAEDSVDGADGEDNVLTDEGEEAEKASIEQDMRSDLEYSEADGEKEEHTENADLTIAGNDPQSDNSEIGNEPPAALEKATPSISESTEAPQPEQAPLLADEQGEEIPIDYQQIIDGLNAKTLALEAENKQLKAKIEGAFGLASKPGGFAAVNSLYDNDTSNIPQMRK